MEMKTRTKYFVIAVILILALLPGLGVGAQERSGFR